MQLRTPHALQRPALAVLTAAAALALAGAASASPVGSVGPAPESNDAYVTTGSP
jgi:hypothetical protein